MKLLRGICVGLALEAVAVGVFWVAADVAGTRRAAPFAAMVLLLAFLIDFGAGRAKAR